MIWLMFAALILAAVIVVLPPLLKSGTATLRETTDLAVYRDQLKEIDNDVGRGLISDVEAEAARIEIKRRVLALPRQAAHVHASKASRPLAMALAGGIILTSFALYVPLGRPTLPARPYDAVAEQDAFKAGLLQEVEAMVSKLAARLKEKPDDREGWRMLGWSYLQLGRVADGIDALKRAGRTGRSRRRRFRRSRMH